MRERGLEAVAMDLPAVDDSAGLSEYADAVVGAIGDRIDLVLVAQSLGGFTAPLVCEQVSVDLLGTLNAMVPSPGGFAGEWWTNTGHAKAQVEQAARDVGDLTADEGLRDALFHDVPARGHGRGVGEGRSKPVRDTIRAAVAPAEVARGADEVPAGPRRSLLPGGISAQGRGRTFGHYPDEKAGGHLVALSRPKELADRLEAYREGIAGEADG